MNKVNYGVNNMENKFAGRTVGWVRQQLAGMWGIDPRSKGHVGGTAVEDAHVIQEGQELEFAQPAGTKGFAA